MPEKMLKMNNQVRKRLKSQAKEMGIAWKDAQITWNDKTGYAISGYEKFKVGKAVDQGVKEGSLATKMKNRKRRLDEAIEGKQ